MSRSIARASSRSRTSIGALEDGTELPLVQRWPVRRPRPVAERVSATRPLVTGQRVFDLSLPGRRGRQRGLPGGFGTGKTVIEQSLAKWADADIVVYVGCGERGNEMTDVLTEFPELVDPRTGQPVMDRTVLVVNTSNMPVARARGVDLPRRHARRVLPRHGQPRRVMADSTSRWAEALREIGRAPGGDARRGRLPHVPREPPRDSSTSAPVRVARSARPARRGSVTHRRRGLAAGRRLLRAGDADRASRRRARSGRSTPSLAHQRHFPGHRLGHELLALRRRRSRRGSPSTVARDWAATRAALLDLLAEGAASSARSPASSVPRRSRTQTDS